VGKSSFKLFFALDFVVTIDIIQNQTDHLQGSIIQTSRMIIQQTSTADVSNITTTDIESLQNTLHKVCCVPATSAGLPRVSFFFFFVVAAAIYSINKANKAGSMHH
jgi:hypothetical protein